MYTGLHKAFFHVLLADRDDFNQILYEWIRCGQVWKRVGRKKKFLWLEE